MSRKARIIIPKLAHHITQRGNNRQIVFENDSDYQHYCFWANKYAALNGLDIVAYCLMPNHVHFIVIPEGLESVSKTFQTVHTLYAQYMLKKRGASGHLWQGRFYSCVMDDQHLYRAIRYVEKNPVRSQIVKRAWRYPWSSVRWHLGLSSTSLINLKNIELVDQSDWKEYLGETDEEFEKDLRIQTHACLAVGTPSFIWSMEKQIGYSLKISKVGRPKLIGTDTIY